MFSLGRLSFMTVVSIWIAIAVKGIVAESLLEVHMLGCIKNRKSNNAVTFEVTLLNPNDTIVTGNIINYTNLVSTFTLNSKEIFIQRFDAAVEVIGSGLSRKGIKITSDGELLVYASSSHISQHDLGGYLSLPVRVQGNIYYVVTGKDNGVILIVGVWSNTTVEVSLLTNYNVTYNDTVYVNGSIIMETLDEYSTMQIYSTGDLTGTRINSSQTVSVFSGNRLSGTYPNMYHVVEQLPPLHLWGKTYVTAPPRNFTYHCKVTSSLPLTIVTYTCKGEARAFALAETGSFETLNFEQEICLLTSTEPILVTMMINNDTALGSMTIMSPLDDVTGSLMTYVSRLLTNAEIVIISNTSLKMEPASISPKFIECPSFLGYCITHLENLTGNTVYTITSGSGNDSFIASGFVHGQTATDDSTAYPLLYHTSASSAYNGQMEKALSLDNKTTTLAPEFYQDVISNTDQNLQKAPEQCKCCSFKNYSMEEIANYTKSLKKELTVNPNTTSKYLRTLSSAEDQRISSKFIGYTAAIVLGTLGACLLIADIGNILQMFRFIGRAFSNE
ncbi:uncharacterized protein [Argopecten irradians]|uniref:uncharacterized protein n=1 Tax=Argopecten irradians TaxID=31199 RepID=UPI0037160902